MDVGQNFVSIGFLTGGPNYFFSHYTALDHFEKDRIWEEIKAHNHNRELITTKSSANQAEDSSIQPAHAYCVLDQLELSTGRYLLMRNPWGNRKTTVENENGQFFMDFNEYLELMDYTYINYDTT